MTGIDQTWANWLAGIGSLFIGALVVALFARAAKKGDQRAAAETALWNAAPLMIKEQNLRIDNLSNEITRLWDENRQTRAREEQCLLDLKKANGRITDLELRLDRRDLC